MIIGRTQSADGGFRRIPIRHTQIVDETTRKNLVAYLKEEVFRKCQDEDWVGSSDLFPDIPNDILGTPLEVIYDLCCERFSNEPNSLKINISKYVGMLVREAVYYSDVRYYEQMIGSVRKYSLESKKLSGFNPQKNIEELLYGRKK